METGRTLGTIQQNGQKTGAEAGQLWGRKPGMLVAPWRRWRPELFSRAQCCWE